MPSPLSSKLDWVLANPLWAASLNPILSNPLNTSQILTGISLVTGANIIPHKLGKIMQGWNLTDINSGVTVYRSAPFNSTNLTLTSSGPATVNIEVF